MIKLQLPIIWGVIPGVIVAAWAFYAFMRRQDSLGVVVTCLTVLLFVSLFGAIRSFPTQFVFIPGDAELKVGDTLPADDQPVYRVGRD